MILYVKDVLHLADDMNIKDLKNKHKGEDCFVIGNGPSVNDHNFSLLLNKNLIVTNCFHQHPLWPKFKNIYHVELNGAFRLHPSVTEWKVKQLLKNENANYIFRMKFKSIWDNLPLPNNKKYYLKLHKPPTVMEGKYNWDISEYSLWANTGVIEGSMALAQYMGFKNIYLIGCDVSGFYERGGYFYDWKKTPQVYHPRKSDSEDFENMKKSWETISKKFKEKNINIYNLSKFSKLCYFKRKKMEEVL
jgi:hypothetical protein